MLEKALVELFSDKTGGAVESQADLAKALNVNLKNVQRWEGRALRKGTVYLFSEEARLQGGKF